MTLPTRTLRIGIATLAATTGLLLTAGPATAETPEAAHSAPVPPKTSSTPSPAP
ncbi:hypothetical protein [Nocardia asteroides]|uniref:hypothetical protein n=1 Tax=Nocardia asteroides TaxID=1824 RepID=UPI00343BBC7A